jgi:G3E family GTPase
VLDGVISVIDVENWGGYEDTSYTAKLQAQYTDLIVFNKWEAAGERRFDECLDRVGDLGVETPWVKSDRGVVDKGVLLGIDGALFAKEEGVLEGGHGHGHGHENGHEHKHDHQSEVEVLSVLLKTAPGQMLDVEALERLLQLAPREEVYRIKGIFRCSAATPPVETSDDMESRKKGDASERRYYILNWAFGRWTCTPSTVVAESVDESVAARLTLILARYESGKWKKKLEAGGFVHVAGGETTDLVVERLV